MKFVTEFLPQILPLIIFMVSCIVMLVLLQRLIQRERNKGRAKKKAEIMNDLYPAAQTSSKLQAMEDDPLAELNFVGGSIDLDDDPLAELNAARLEEELPDKSEDPLADLNAARMEAASEAVKLETLVENHEKGYEIPNDPVAVKTSADKTTNAKLLLSILRDKEDKRLMIMETDTAYRSLVDAPELKKRFTNLMKELSTVVLKPDTAESDSVEQDELTSLLAGIDQEEPHQIAKDLVTVRLITGDTTSARELLCILRDEADGRLMLLLGSRAYRTLHGEEKMKKGFTSLIKELSSVILQPDTRPVPVKQSDPSPSGTRTVSFDVDAVSPAQSVQGSEIEEEEEEVIPGVLPDFSIPDNPDNYKRGRFGRVSVKRVDQAPEVNIAEAIEAFLQYKIERTPEFQNRGIHIRPSPGGGVTIQAEGKSYDFVDEIEDVAIRKFVQDTIAEWQEHN